MKDGTLKVMSMMNLCLIIIYRKLHEHKKARKLYLEFGEKSSYYNDAINEAKELMKEVIEIIKK